jgi:3-(3-hydroxy-phenyl)propionate hydroxylase
MAKPHVIVVGAGPVGLSAALVLASSNVRVTVLEAGTALSTASRASTFHPPTLDLLEEFGLASALIEIGLIADRYQMRDRESGLVAEFDLGVLREDTAFPFRVQCEQSRYTPLALNALSSFEHATVRFGHAVDDVERHDDRVVVHARTEQGNVTIAGDYLIGADGARSAARQAAGIAFEGMTYPERYLVALTTYDLSLAIPGLAPVNYISDPREFVVLLHLPDGWRAMFPIAVGESDEDAMSSESIERRLQGLVAIDGSYPVLHSTLYRVHQRVAATMRSGRVLLAGDAAHINNPLGGMGMNSGIHDAFSAARKLARVLHGESDDRVLDAYAEDRRNVALHEVKVLSHENVTQMQEPDPDERRRGQDELRRVASDPELMRRFLFRRTLIGPLRESGVLS